MIEFVERFEASPGRRPLLLEDERVSLLFTLKNDKAVRLFFNGRNKQSVRDAVKSFAKLNGCRAHVQTIQPDELHAYLERRAIS